ncbi:MAG: tyrosine-type recombinase/integrase [Planctomycetota bacterium]
MEILNTGLAMVKEPANGASSADLLDAFLADKSSGTVRSYSDDLSAFRIWMKHQSLHQTITWLVSRNVTEAALLTVQYRAFLIRTRQSPASINRRMTVLRQLVECARRLGKIGWSLEIRNVRNHRFDDTRGTGICGIEAIVAAAEMQEPRKASRDGAIISLLYTLSLSRNSIANLNIENCDLERSILHIVRPSKMETKLAIPSQTLETLKEWLQIRGDAPGPLFVGMSDFRRLSASGIYRVLRTLAKRAGASVPEALEATVCKV